MPTDIQLNTFHDEYGQEAPATAALAGGGFVAVWDDNDQDPGTYGWSGVYGRVFDARGRAVTFEFRVNADTDDQQFGARVVALPDGGFVVAWNSDGADRAGDDNSYVDVFMQRFSATGERVGPQVQVSPVRSGDHRLEDQRLQDLVSLPDGGFRIVYCASDVRTDWDVYTRRFDAEARPVGGEVLINSEVDTHLAQAFRTLTPGYQLAPTADGGFIAAYWEAPESAHGEQIYTQRYDAAGRAIGARQQVSVLEGWTDNSYPRVATLDGGGYAVTWTQEDDENLDDTDVFVRTYDAAGRALTGPVRVNTELEEGQFLGDITPLPNGGFLVTYASWYDLPGRESYQDFYEARGRLFDSRGRPTSDTFDISEFVYEDMGALSAIRLRDGSLVFTWQEGDSIEEDVFGTVVPATQGTARNDEIDAVLPGAYRGFGGNDTLVGSEGADTLSGDAGDDLLFGALGRDWLDGGTGADTLYGWEGDDSYVVDERGDVVYEERAHGVDAVRALVSFTLPADVENLLLLGRSNLSGTGNAGANAVTGNMGNNALNGGLGADTLAGGAGRDALGGDAGADRLEGGAGADRLTGGTGPDAFVFRSAADSTVSLAGRDFVVDFSRAERDRLDLSGMDANAAAAGDQAFAFIGARAFTGVAGQLSYGRSGGDTVVYGDVNGDRRADFAIALDGSHVLQAGDFLL